MQSQNVIYHKSNKNFHEDQKNTSIGHNENCHRIYIEHDQCQDTKSYLQNKNAQHL